jgi:hypothetical protein
MTEEEATELCRAMGRNLRKEVDRIAEENGVTKEQVQAEIDKLVVIIR